MKRLYFKALWLTSFREKRARKIVFDPKITVVKGENDTGKSCLIKSIYNAMGADSEFEPTWKQADVKSVINFIIDDREFYLLRDGRLFSIYDSNMKLLDTFQSRTKELAPYFSEMFDFHLALTSPKGEDYLATPAFLFLPFYIDQDLGWRNSFESFKNLSQFSRWRGPVVEYHSGIKPKEFYQKQLEKNDIENELSEKRPEYNFIKEMLEKQQNQYRDVDFNVDVNEFKKDVDRLIQEVNVLKKDETKYKNEILKVADNRAFLQSQLEIVSGNIKERKKDLDVVDGCGGEIECPMCNTAFENIYEERLDIAIDLGDMNSYQSELNQEIAKLDGKATKLREKLSILKEQGNRVKEILSVKKKKISLKDVIVAEGKREFIGELKKDFDKKQKEISTLEDNIASIKEELKKLTDKDRIAEIKDHYFINMKKNLFDLDVQNIEEKSYKNITAKVSKSGSDQPRALLAYFYSFLNTAKTYSSTTFCPIVIDSPNQQDQDDINVQKIFNFIFKNTGSDEQLILGTVSDHDIEHGGTVLELSEKNHLLLNEEFEECSLFFGQLFEQIKTYE